MGRKIFISYKYGDRAVHPLPTVSTSFFLAEPKQPTTVRHYVDELQKLLQADDHINKGELDGEDLSDFKESTITSRLRDKIYDSSITIVMISPGMKDDKIPESDQWIPWEISYSLRERTRNERTSKPNALLAVVLPDQNNSYDYYIEENNCCSGGCRKFMTSKVFQIIIKNMFNNKNLTRKECLKNEYIYISNPSYIHTVKWDTFKTNPDRDILLACLINENINNYELVKIVD